MTQDRDEQFLDLATKYRTLAKDYRDTLLHGSLNFRRYRRRATAAFVVLMLATTAEGWWISQISADGRDNLAKAGAKSTYDSCVSGNRVRSGIVTFLEKLAAKSPNPERAAPTLAAARVTFAPRDCTSAAQPLADQAR